MTLQFPSTEHHETNSIDASSCSMMHFLIHTSERPSLDHIHGMWGVPWLRTPRELRGSLQNVYRLQSLYQRNSGLWDINLIPNGVAEASIHGYCLEWKWLVAMGRCEILLDFFTSKYTLATLSWNTDFNITPTANYLWKNFRAKIYHF
jgi:hypothetical protein